MNITQTSPQDPVVLALFSEHDDFMTAFLAQDAPSADGWQYTRYTEAEAIEAVWVAYCQGRPAGCVAYRSKDAVAGELKRLFIHQEYRGRGLSKELVQTVLRHAKDRGCRVLVLDTRATLEPAVSLYRCLGFQVIFQQGAYIQMELRL